MTFAQPSLVRATPSIVPTGDRVRTPRRLLLVDDEGTFRLALRHYLERRGWAVDEAPDGSSALERLLVVSDAREYTAVLCDLNMPGLSGQALHARLVAMGSPAVPKLVFSTGDTFDPDVLAFLDGSGGRWFQKPFELRKLAELLEVMHGATAGALAG